jgi:multidrug efflux system outer membrane protein
MIMRIEMGKHIAWIGLIGCALMTSSCTAFRPEGVSDVAASDLPAAYGAEPEAGSPLQDRWWEAFQDTQLNNLVARALESNLSLKQAAARLEQARYLATIQGASQLPTVNVEASASTTRRDQAGTTTESYQLGPAVSYELDLWGRVRASRNAAALEAQATQSDRGTVAMTVSAQVVLTYLQLLSQTDSLALLEQQIADNRKVLELITIRYGNAQATALDILQQQEVVAAAEALLPAVQAAKQQLQHALAVLLGLPPGDNLNLTLGALPDMPPPPSTGVPADLLVRRPDVAAAQWRLEKATWTVSAAQADRLPTLRLTGSAAYSSDDVATLFDDWFAQLAAGLTGPLLDGGRRRAEVRRTQAVVNERLAAYRSTLLTAIQEVEDALVQEARQRETLQALDRQIRAAENTYNESLRRYLNGQLSFLTVVTADLGLQRLNRERLQAHYQLLAYRVGLYRALGGNWQHLMDQTDETDNNTKESPSS